MKVLVIEDDVPTSKLLCRLLAQREGYETVPAFSAEEAQVLYQKEFFPLVLLDLNLPRMSGLDFSRWLRQQPTGDRTYILVGTGEVITKSRAHLLKNILKAGADDYISKPYQPGLFGVRLAVAEKQIANFEQRKRLETALKEEKDFVSAVVETTAVFIVVLDVNLNVIRTNPAFQKIADPGTNYSLDFQRELLGPETFPAVMAALQGTLKAESPIAFSAEMIMADGKHRHVSWTATIVSPDTSTEARIICSGIDITERHDAQQRLAFLALHDPLTECYNRNYLMRALKTALQNAREGISSAMVNIDLDHFKIVNDTAGHLAGDRLLVTLVHLFRDSILAGDTIIRFGGDEFIIILNGVTVEEARLVAERIREWVDDFVFFDSDKPFRVSVSIGIAMIEPTLTPEQIISRADSACYAAKANGRNSVKIYEASQSQVNQLQVEINWRDRIRSALREDTFDLLYQPVVEISTARISFYEALLRLKDEGGGLIEPRQFLPAAERLKIMPQIDRHVIGKIGRVLVMHSKLKVSINLSTQSLGDPGMVDFIKATFLPLEVSPGRICFEITETAMISDLQGAGQVLRELQGLGFHFALDDFGVGFSSFEYLKHLPVEYLKIDGSFITNLASQPVNRVFVKGLNQIAHGLNIKTVAECVETAEDLEALKELEIDFAQGFHIGRPNLQF